MKNTKQMLALKNRYLTDPKTYMWQKETEQKKTNICSHKKMLALKNRNLDRYLTYPQTYTRLKKMEHIPALKNRFLSAGIC